MTLFALYLAKVVLETLCNFIWVRGYRICSWADCRYARAQCHSEMLYKIYGAGLWMFNINSKSGVSRLHNFLGSKAPHCYLRINGKLVAHRHSGYCGYFDCEDVEKETSETLEGWLTDSCGYPTDQDIADMMDKDDMDRVLNLD